MLSERGSTYDQRGNCIESRQRLVGGNATTGTNAGKAANAAVAMTKMRYDAWDRLTETTDPENNKTYYTYSIETLAGKKALSIKRCDAKGRRHITLHYPNGQIAEERDVDSLGVVLKSHKLFYDANGQIIQRVDSVYMDGTHIRDVVTKWVYDASGNAVKLIEAVGTSEERQTHTLYTLNGQPKRVKLPSEEVHEFVYNVKGDKLQHYDERGSFSFHYHYDALGQLVEVVDQVTAAGEAGVGAAGNSTKRRMTDVEGYSKKHWEMDSP